MWMMLALIVSDWDLTKKDKQADEVENDPDIAEEPERERKYLNRR